MTSHASVSLASVYNTFVAMFGVTLLSLAYRHVIGRPAGAPQPTA